jgi:hypothetical protein
MVWIVALALFALDTFLLFGAVGHRIALTRRRRR